MGGKQTDMLYHEWCLSINLIERERVFFGTVDQIRERLKAEPLLLQIPVGIGPPHVADPFRGVIDLITMEAVTFPPKEDVLSGAAAAVEPIRSSIPAELEAEAAMWREQLVSTLFDYSDELAELAIAECGDTSRVDTRDCPESHA